MAAAVTTMIPASMNAVIAATEPGGAPTVRVASRPVPAPAAEEVLIQVHATGTNRAEILQAAGTAPAPKGVTSILGLEAAGIVVALGSGAATIGTASGKPPAVGDRVLAIVVGGGHAEYVCAPASILVPIPEGMSWEVAAALPEQWQTAYQLLFKVAALPFVPPPSAEPETVLVYAAGSGVGTAAIQLLTATGRRAIAIAGSDAKLETARSLGAVAAFNYKTQADWADALGGDCVPVEAFADQVLGFTSGKGVNVVLDCVGGSFFEQTASAMAVDGVWVLYGLLGGAAVPGPVLGRLLRKRISLRATTLRARSDAYKADLARSFAADVLPRIGGEAEAAASGVEASVSTVFPVIAEAFKGLESVQKAFDAMLRSENVGKFVIVVRE